MCNILKMTDFRAKQMNIWNLWSYSVCGHSVNFAKFLILRFSRHHSSHSFYPISTKFIQIYGKHGNRVGWGWGTGYYFIRRYAKFNENMAVWKYWAQDHIDEAGNFKHTRLGISKFRVFVQSHPIFMGALATMVKYRILPFLAIGQVFKKMCHLESLTWGSMGKS